MPRSLLPRLGDMLFVSLLAGALLLGQRMINVDSDLGRHLALGRFIISSHNIPTKDVLSHTHLGEDRPPYEWLSQVALAGIDHAMGLDGVVLLVGASISVAFLVVYADARSRSSLPLIAMGFTVIAVLGSSLHWLTRPHAFSFVFWAIWLWQLERLRCGERSAMWQLPLTMLVWANVHGGFIFGFVALAAYAVGHFIDRMLGTHSPRFGASLLIVAVSSILASWITPDFWDNWVAVLRNHSAYVLQRTVETRPADLTSPGTWPFLALLVMAFVLMALVRSQTRPSHAILLLTLGGLAVSVARNIPLFAIAAPPILASWTATALRKYSTQIPIEDRVSKIESGWIGAFWPTAAIAVAAVMLSISAKTTGHARFNFDPGRYPVQAADWISAHPPEGMLFNDVNWGGYVLYRLWPETRVFIDSQSDFYGEPALREYEAMMLGAAALDQALAQHDIAWILVPSQSSLAGRLRSDLAWHPAYEDSTAVIYVRAADSAK